MSGEQRTRMVHVRTVPSAFHAKVIAARLGADGIVTELRGNVGGPYPFGEASVWVPEGEAEVACALLLADEVEASLATVDDHADAEPGRSVWLQRLLAGAGLLALAGAALAAHLGL